MVRFRDFRKTEELRASIRETRLEDAQLVQPFFVVEGKNKKNAIASMPGIFQYSVDKLIKAVESYIKIGGQSVILFGVPNSDKKNSEASFAYDENGIVQTALRTLKKEFSNLQIITDVCLCSYTEHGHCGVIEEEYVDNDKTLPILSKVAVSHAEAGADIVAPSDMMDYRVRYIRESLNENDFLDVDIMSYAVKYASSFYGPFRDAACSTPQFGDRKTYQMDYCNREEGLQEAQQDVVEGADIVMVKPAMAYLDVVALLKQNLSVPIAAYNVSGEYSMVKAAAQNGWINEKELVIENLTCIKRAGADIILTYHTQEVLSWIKNG